MKLRLMRDGGASMSGLRVGLDVGTERKANKDEGRRELTIGYAGII